MRQRQSDYTPIPAVPEEVVPRLTAILTVLSGLKTVSQAARELGLSRNRFQSLMHRSLEALVMQLAPHAAGRPPTPAQVAALRTELQRLQRENAKLRSQVGSTERLLEVASGLLQGRIRTTGRQPRKRKPSANHHDGDDDDGEAHRRAVLAGADAMRALKLNAALAARIAGVGASTLRRWHAQQRRGRPLIGRRARRTVDPKLAAQAQRRVRRLHGQIGAAALSHAIAGLTRRAAAAIKADTLSALERERKTTLTRIRISVPGVLRGLDAMEFRERPAERYALIAADGAIPYRTCVTVGARYDAALVERALERDLQENGAPLVYRLDRARCHDTPAVRQLLAAHRILLLHGPPRCPRFYGQLERQNREHRAWLAADRATAEQALAPRLREMLERVNREWPRRTLGFKTAADVWSARPPLTIDRIALREEVTERVQRIARTRELRGHPADLAERLAIEQTLTRLGYLRQETGGWC
jgi:hypothetical protein